MSRLFRIFGVAAIIICALTLYRSLEQSGRSVAADPSSVLEAMRHSLVDSGLHQRDDVSIELNNREVALGFSRSGCDGLMLVAILPQTAQSWAHMAPRLDLSSFQVGYLYQGALYREVPRLERLVAGLRGDLGPHGADAFPQVVAIAESGHCGLARSVAPVLEAVSRGRLTPAEHPESATSIGDLSA